MGRGFDQKQLLNEIANGFRGEHPNTKTYGTEYEDGHYAASRLSEVHKGGVEVKTDERTHEEWLEIAGQRVTDLIGRLQENKLRKEDIDPELITVVASIEKEERATNEVLSDEHPKFTAALGEWLSRDEAYAKADEPEVQTVASIEFFESLMVELSEEKKSYESELGMWLENNQNQPRVDELISGVAQYNEFIELANHHRMEALASVYRAEIERLYELAA